MISPNFAAPRPLDRVMMRNAAILMAVAAVALPGCDDHHDGHFWHDEGIVYTSGPWYIQYDNGHPIAASSSDPFILNKEAELFNLVNNHRAALGVPALIHNEPTRDVARAHSIHMSIGGFTDEINPEGDDPGNRADIAGLPWSLYAENIEYGLEDAIDVFNEWLSWPSTHDPIDDPDFVYAGAGYEHDSESTWNDYWTMDFRRP